MNIPYRTRFGKLAVSALVAGMAAASAYAGVCKIGSTEYDSLQEALYAIKSLSGDKTVTLLQDIDVTSVIDVPKYDSRSVTIDGSGHAIRQAYAGRVFQQTNGYWRATIIFKDVTILGGGEEFSTASEGIFGTFFYLDRSEAGSLVLDSGCVVSNFVSGGPLIGAETAKYPKWNIHVKPGSVIACNSSSSDYGCIFCLNRLSNGYAIHISGGEIFGNSAPKSVIAYLGAYNQNRTNPILVVSGGSIHDNVVIGYAEAAASYTKDLNGLFWLNQGPLAVSVTGGEIFDNEGAVFALQPEGGYTRVLFSGGKIFGNAGFAVYDYSTSSTLSMYLSGDAMVAGNGGNSGSAYINGKQGFYARVGSSPVRMVLEGDFTGFATLNGTASCTGTNLLFYSGAENIHWQGGNSIYATNPDTGAMSKSDPPSAKIGATEYATLEAAISAASDGATVTLLRDWVCVASIVPPANKTITIDGDGHRIFRSCKNPLVAATTAGGNMTFTNVELNEGFFCNRDSYTNHVDGVIVNTADGVAATITLGPGTVLSGGRGTNALVRVANGATVNLDGAVITGVVNRAVAASAGGTLGVKGATIVKDNAGGDVDVADGNVLSLNGDLTGRVHVTVAGAEAYEGQRFGTRTGNWSGLENFVNGGSDSKLVVSKRGALVWCHRGFLMMFQ